MTSNTTKHVASFLKENVALLAILAGAALVSISLGPYSNWDAQTEFAAASSVVQSGMPYATPGNLINQPPVAFYINAMFLRVFGLSYEIGVAAVTLFAVGCVFLVYMVGKTMYSTRIGLVAAGVFALTPWHVVLSRSFLIDVPCLFFSLLALLVGIWAMRKASLMLTLVSGIFFGVAFLTKFFAVFTLIPLALVFVYYMPKSLKRVLGSMMLFVTPALIMYYVWYEVISKLGFLSAFTHTDFLSTNQGVTPSPFFLMRFFIDNPGLLLLIAVGVSVAVSLWRWRDFSETAFFDIVCVATIVGTAGVNMYLVLGQGLWVPYVDPVKYDYQLLPALCLLAASLFDKAGLLGTRLKTERKRNRLPLFVAVAGIILLIASIVVNAVILGTLPAKDYLLFRVEGDVGFSFERLVPTIGQMYLAPVQDLGFVLVIFSLFWANKDRFSRSGT